MIKLIDLTKLYKGFPAVNHINLEVKEGMIFGFLGPNGAGKTTTIRMMAGVLKPTEGRVIINGMDIGERPAEVKRCTGFIPDRPFLYEKLTGIEFLRFISGLYHLEQNPRQEKQISEWLELFELIHWGDELIESYSHGMKQRLVMCAALIHRPRVIIVDEPMVGLDPKGARLVKDIFREQARKGRLNRKETSIDDAFLAEVFGDGLGYRGVTESTKEYECNESTTIFRDLRHDKTGASSGRVGQLGACFLGGPRGFCHG